MSTANSLERGIDMKVAFEIEKKGYTFKATLIEPKNDALVEIFKGNNLIKEFLFPAYKIWNIAAHLDDIIDGLEEESDYGLHIAGSDGLGGNCYTKQNKGGLTMSHQVIKTIDCIHEKACDKIADWDLDDETIPCSGCARYVPAYKCNCDHHRNDYAACYTDKKHDHRSIH